MTPLASSVVVPPDCSAQQLLRLGKPFLDFPRFSILELQRASTSTSSGTNTGTNTTSSNPPPPPPPSFSQWLAERLRDGLPFVICDFDQLPAWQEQEFSIEKLIELSTKKNIPIRNCSTGRDLSFTLRKFADSARQSYQEFQNLYARDLPCPQEWQEHCRRILPTEVQWGGRLDLFQWLPQCARSEVMMAYVGSEGSSSGFHRCFSSTVALNLLVESDDRPVVCIGTDFESQKKYDDFMSKRGISPHVDWLNLGTEELLNADFPLYAYDQKVGDLVVFPPATAHQVWNPSTLSTKLVWNILHPESLEIGFSNVQPSFNRLCHPDVARTNLSLACAMLSLIREDAPAILPPDLPTLSKLFRRMFDDENIDVEPATPIQFIQLSTSVIATCNFCSTAIWNRHVRCTVCADFDLCLACYLNGRSCEHIQSYVWAELVRPNVCDRILVRAGEILGFQPEEPRVPDRCKTLATAVNDLMKAKLNTTSRLCHLCRIDHPDWKGRRCDKCSAFSCYRGLYRHFDYASSEVLRHSGLWSCPKCLEICNCRCCHFVNAHEKDPKPASKRRVKPADPRGKVMGFTDNVFDQKRGQRGSNQAPSATHVDLPGLAHVTGRKRQFSSTDSGHATPLRKIELPTPEPDFGSRSDMRASREGSDYPLDSPYTFGKTDNQSKNSRPILLPSIKAFSSPPPQHQQYLYSPLTTMKPPTPSSSLPAESPISSIGTYASSAISHISHHLSPSHFSPTTLPPMLAQHARTSASPRAPEHNGFSHTMHPDTHSSNIHPGQHSSSSHPFDPSGQTHVPGVPPAWTSAAAPDAAVTALDARIAHLEEQISLLQRYVDEFMALDLADSQKVMAAKLDVLRAELRARKKEKGGLLVSRLVRDGQHLLRRRGGAGGGAVRGLSGGGVGGGVGGGGGSGSDGRFGEAEGEGGGGANGGGGGSGGDQDLLDLEALAEGVRREIERVHG